MAANSSSRDWKYDVFLSFRGPDTRKILVGHLRQALLHKGLTVFVDTEELPKGQVLQALLKAIEDSKVSIVVFSQDYASSTWCLKEVTKIMECMKEKKQRVVPVFYQVDPAHVRYQKGNFEEAFAKHEKDSRESKEVLQRWRSALADAANLSGWDSRDYKSSDALLIQHIAEDIVDKLRKSRSSESESGDLVGMKYHIQKVEDLLSPGLNEEVRTVGIWGMGGLGKTTIARAVYNKLSYDFDACCFLEDVRHNFKTKGEGQMQLELLFTILKERIWAAGTSSMDSEMIIEMLSKKKLLLVLDNVDNLAQMEALLGKRRSFCGGSRIIITTRDKHLLSDSVIYNPKFLDYKEALELFGKYAKPSTEHSHLLKRAMDYAQGLPLAVKVLGAFLRGKSVLEWDDELEKMRTSQHNDIKRVLVTSIEGLDKSQREIFLDVACFFRGIKRDYATLILYACDLFPEIELRFLSDRALINTSGYYSQVLEMHDSLQDMALQIVREDLRLTRLTIFNNDIEDVLSRNKGIEGVESIDVDLYTLKNICINLNALEGMENLRLLRIHYKRSIDCIDEYTDSHEEELYHLRDDYKQTVRGNLKFLSEELRCLIWHGCPLRSLPSGFCPRHLVDLDMRCSLLEQLWEANPQPLNKLKFINLSRSTNLKETPDLSDATKVEKVNFEGCTSLCKVHPSVFDRKSLTFLSLKDCKELEILPSSMAMKSLDTLELSGCTKLKTFPEILEIMEKPTLLCLDNTAIEKLPSSIVKLARLTTLSLKDCKELTTLPRSICQLKSLRYVFLSGCSKLVVFPEIAGLEDMAKLIELHLDGTAIKEFLPSTSSLKNLAVLNLRGCKELKSLPSSIGMVSLRSLILSGCSNLQNFPEISGTMSWLSELELDDIAIKYLHPSIKNFTKLRYLSLRDCGQIRSLPISIFQLRYLEEIIVSGCSKFEELPEIVEPDCTNLVTLSLKDCEELKSLPSTFYLLRSLRFVSLSGCSKFEVFPEIPADMEELRELHLDGTSIKELSPSVERLKMLMLLNLRNCGSLVSLPGNLCKLSYLTPLNLSGCSALNCLPMSIADSKSVLDDMEKSDIKQPCSLPCASTNLLVGMKRHISEMQLLLKEDDSRIVGIGGMCGIGKTTIARAVYETVAKEFEYHCFFEDVRKLFRKEGAVSLQGEFLSRISKEKVHNVGNLNRGSTMIKNRLGMKKVLLVLDDVDDIAQIDTLIGKPPSFGAGSKIIVTARDEQMLNRYDIYCPKLSDDEALVLFRQYAFRTMEESAEHEGLSKRAIQYAQRLPLALKVLGSFLSFRSIPKWVSTLKNIKTYRHKQIETLLETCFDGLDDSEKMIFLDVACFFNGMKEDYATEILRCCGFFPHSGLRVLIGSGLMDISHRDRTLKMYDLVVEVGKEKSRLESVHGPGERSRLWSSDGIECLSKGHMATDAVEAINIDLSESAEVWFSADAFVKMNRLRLLRIVDEHSTGRKQHVSGGLEFLSHELRCLIWHRYPLKSLSSNFNSKNLVDLDLQFSCLEQIWEGSKLLQNLKFINLSYSPNLKGIPDLTEAKNLEKLILDGCTSLSEVHTSIWDHKNIVVLSLRGCSGLKFLPKSIYLKSLQTFNLDGCSGLEKFPVISEVMTVLSELKLDETAIRKLPSSIECLRGLESLSLKNCTSLVSLPDSMCNLVHLQQLYLDGCSKLSKFPEKLRNAQSLKTSGMEELLKNREADSDGITESSSESGEETGAKEEIRTEGNCGESGNAGSFTQRTVTDKASTSVTGNATRRGKGRRTSDLVRQRGTTGGRGRGISDGSGPESSARIVINNNESSRGSAINRARGRGRGSTTARARRSPQATQLINTRRHVLEPSIQSEHPTSTQTRQITTHRTPWRS